MDANPIKDCLFEYIGNSQTIPRLISEKKFDRVVDEITDGCYDRIISIGERPESVGVMATGLLHYLLTCSLVSSQRKVEFRGVDLDIVIPNVRTLEGDPKRALLVCIPGSEDPRVIEQKIAELEGIQPEGDNIWMVLSRDIPVRKKSFALSKECNTFSRIIFEIAQFANVAGSKFKILKI